MYTTRVFHRFSPIFRSNLVSSNSCRFISTELVNTQVDDKTGIATVTMNRPPVNGLSLELFRDLSKALDLVESNKSRGMILTSSLDTVFCAGLDLNEVHKPDKDRFREFWTTFQDVWLKLFGSGFPTAAAINGHAPAGGCLLAMSCEYRVMRRNFTIGLNESRVGIICPTWVMATMENVLSRRETELALTLGTMFSTEKAHEIGLVDQVVDTKEEAIDKCVEFIQLFNKIPKLARDLTKQVFRKNFIAALDREEDLQTFYHNITRPEAQEHFVQYLANLRKRKEKK